MIARPFARRPNNPTEFRARPNGKTEAPPPSSAVKLAYSTYLARGYARRMDPQVALPSPPYVIAGG